jgi:3-deoxy-manno-octulosonate cytidylyltransferase (CMP-KDO synthetase)
MIIGIIPARYASTRFPAKPLAAIKGKPMIQRTYEQVAKAKYLSKVVVATDHKEIFDCVRNFGGEVVMTSEAHQSGTDRCYEALEKIEGNFEYVINIQGDEPFIQPEQIDQLAEILHGNQIQIATLSIAIKSEEELFNPNVVKVVTDKAQNALYFSRNPIPYMRGISQNEWLKKGDFYKHVGIYAYRTDILKQITKLSVSLLEKAESLEQLRWLENGYQIKVGTTTFESFGIDTPEDLSKYLGNIGSIITQ